MTLGFWSIVVCVFLVCDAFLSSPPPLLQYQLGLRVLLLVCWEGVENSFPVIPRQFEVFLCLGSVFVRQAGGFLFGHSSLLPSS